MEITICCLITCIRRSKEGHDLKRPGQSFSMPLACRLHLEEEQLTLNRIVLHRVCRYENLEEEKLSGWLE